MAWAWTSTWTPRSSRRAGSGWPTGSFVESVGGGWGPSGRTRCRLPPACRWPGSDVFSFFFVGSDLCRLARSYGGRLGVVTEVDVFCGRISCDRVLPGSVCTGARTFPVSIFLFFCPCTRLCRCHVLFFAPLLVMCGSREGALQRPWGRTGAPLFRRPSFPCSLDSSVRVPVCTLCR